MKTMYIAVLLACIAGLGFVMMSESEDSEGAVTNPTNATLVGDVWYTIWDGEAIVRGPSSVNLTSITIPSTVTIDGNTYTVTGIAGMTSYTNEGAFMDMQQLTTVTLPYTLESFNAQYSANTAGATYSNAFCIYPSATAKVSRLTTVNWDIPSGETAHLTSIGGNAFWNCSALTTFSIPDSVTNIGERAFNGCSAYALTAWPTSLTTLGIGALGGTLTALSSLPANITAVPNSLFDNCANITQFTLHSGVTSIGSYAFSGTGITSFTIPNGVSVGENAFDGCTSLQTLTFPSGLTSIPNYVCRGCTNLSTVTLPANVTSIGNYAFLNCSSLHMSLPSSLRAVGEYAFKGATSMELATLPSLTTIPQQAFNGAIGARFVIPSTVTSIDQYAFGMPRSNGNVATNIEVTFDGVKGASNRTVTVGGVIFAESGQAYPANTTFTVNMYGMSYTTSNYFDVASKFANSSNVSFVINNYSKDYILYASSTRDKVTYYAVYGDVDYVRTGITGQNVRNCYTYALGLADDSVTSITIPGSFTYYNKYSCNFYGVMGSSTNDGYGAFGGTSLQSVTLSYIQNSNNFKYNPNGNSFAYANTFKDCIDLTTVTIGGWSDNLIVWAGMFSGCENLTTMVLNRTISYFENDAFNGCSNLTLSGTDLTVKEAGNRAFQGCVSLNPASLTISGDVGDLAFERCRLIDTDELKNINIGYGAFAGCESLSPSVLKDVSVGEFAFDNCTGLSAIVIQGFVEFGDCVFNLWADEETGTPSVPTTEERTLSLLFLTDEVSYTEYTFATDYEAGDAPSYVVYDRIYNISDLGDNGFTSANSGLPEGTEVSNTLTVDSLAMLQKVQQEEQHETVEDKSTTATILRIIPVFVVIGIILGVVTMMYVNRNGL